VRKIFESDARCRERGAVSEVSEVVGSGGAGALRIEENGINVITEGERKGQPRQLFWPWFGANVSVLGLSYGAYILGFGISFWQGLIVGLIGIIISFVLCGIIATAGKRGSAPTMVLSRAAYGVRGNRLPSFISWLLCVGWETVLTVIAVLATSTVFTRPRLGRRRRRQGRGHGRHRGVDHRRRRHGL
jgi:NCS1 family nucleobase:cation symporter-1